MRYFLLHSIKFFNWKDLGLLSPVTGPAALSRHIGDIADIVSGNWDQSLRDQLVAIVSRAVLCANTARANLRGANDTIIKKKLIEMKSSKKEEQVVKSPENSIKSARMALNDIIGLVKSDVTADPQDVKEVMAWIKQIDDAIKNLETSSAGMSQAGIDASLAKITKDFADVKSQWV